MPVEVGIWELEDEGVREVEFSALEAERKLEDALEARPEIVDREMMVVGRQVTTSQGKQMDLLGVGPDGELKVVELKRDRTPRDVVAQVLDYASWVRHLGYDEVKSIYESENTSEFETAFDEAFGDGPPEDINDDHELTVVASELDDSTERIIGYLSEEYGVPINAVFFRHYREAGREYLVRSWLIDPQRAQESQERTRTSKKEVWNGRDYYVSFGDSSEARDWRDARRYGFICGGGGRWYSRTLKMLSPGDRVFVNVPGEGYVGVGEVVDEVEPVTEFEVPVDGQMTPILEAPLKAPNVERHAGDEEKQEYFVRVEWKEARAVEDAVWKTGMFANQNTVCKLRNSFTIEALEEAFGI